MNRKRGYLVKDSIKSSLIVLKQDTSIFSIAFLVLFVFVCADCWLYLPQRANSDVAGEFLYMQKVYSTGNPITPEYVASGELFLSRPWPIFIFYYIFGQNMIVSSKLTVITTWTLMVISTGYMLHNLGWRYRDIFVAISVLFGTACLEIRYVLYMCADAYSLPFVGVLISLGILASYHQNGGVTQFEKAIYFAIAFYFGLCGIRMFCWLYCPVLFAECVRRINAQMRDLEPSELFKLAWGGYLQTF